MKLEELIESIMPLHSKSLEPAHTKIAIPIQTSFEGFYPTSNRRKILVGSFYEGVNRGFYGGRLNDKKSDFYFLNGNAIPSGVKPDIVDDAANLDWETKGSQYDKECKITHNQLYGYKIKQINEPRRKLFFTFYRYDLPLLEKQERVEYEIIQELLRKTLYSVILPFSVVLPLKDNMPSKGMRLARNHIQRPGTTWESCLCISPSTINRFLVNPFENLDYLGLERSRFEVERYISPENFKVNRRKMKRFPIVIVTDNYYDKWISEIISETERPDVESNEIPLFNKIAETTDIPF